MIGAVAAEYSLAVVAKSKVMVVKIVAVFAVVIV